MVPTEQKYELGAEENTFLRTAVLEFMIIQIFREYIYANRSEDEANHLINELRNESFAFSKMLNDEGTPQDVAWDTAMTKMFSRLYETIASPYKKREGTL